MSQRELEVKRQSVKRRGRQMRNRGMNASALVTRSRGHLPRFDCKAKQSQRRRHEISSGISVISEQRMAREGTHENGGFP
jgi:hypothetical protein